MKIFKNRFNLHKEIEKVNCISFVPTMGGLHKGHISLINKSKNYNCKILVSIFINPKQFNKKSDFNSYPKNLSNDIKKLKRLKIDYLYLPTSKDVYNFTVKNKIYSDNFSTQLCGKFRKGHFEGVLNVVNRFLEIIRPKYIFLGLKDFQQLTLIANHILKNNVNTKVIKCRTIREKNGVACSTRNLNLNKDQLKIASNIYNYLSSMKIKIQKNYKSFKINHNNDDLISLGASKIDYIEMIDLKTLKKFRKSKNEFKLFVAYYIKKIRLIDNI
jgi:pantoate--beta-alanine ligase